MELSSYSEPDRDIGTGAELADVLMHYGFESETCDEVAAMDFPVAYKTTRDYLLEVDFDADTILAPWAEEPLDKD